MCFREQVGSKPQSITSVFQKGDLYSAEQRKKLLGHCCLYPLCSGGELVVENRLWRIAGEELVRFFTYDKDLEMVL